MKVLRLPQVIEQSGSSRSSIYAGIKSGDFPAPIKLGQRSVGWLESDINKWIEEQAEKSKEAA